MILHVDMDAFYASVEELDNPQLKGCCVIVGGLSERGVVATANYEARKFGVHSAMPLFQARRNCPDAVFLSPRISRYKDVSLHIMRILGEYSPTVEPLSIDEAYVDVGGCQRLFGSAGDIALLIKQRIKEEIGLTCSLGVAPNKFLAKIASDMHKPDGLTIIKAEDVLYFIESLPVRKVPGVGNKTEDKLRLMGINTLGDVRKYDEKRLIKKLGSFGKRLSEFSQGVDRSVVVPDSETKSVSAEETLARNTADKEILKKIIMMQADKISRELRMLGKKGRTITIKIKDSDFRQITRSVTLREATQASAMIAGEALRLIDQQQMPRKTRLIGVTVSNLKDASEAVQLDIFENARLRDLHQKKLDDAVDEIKERFGKDAITRASFKDPG